MNAKRDWKHLLAIVGVALLLRAAAVVWFETGNAPETLPDENDYLHIARTLTTSKPPVYQSPKWQRLLDAAAKDQNEQRIALRMGDQSMFVEDLPGAHRFMQRMPLYPLVVSAVLRVGGNAHLVRNVRILQILIGSASVLMVYLLASHVFDGRSRLWAGWLAALYPPWIYFTGLILTETLFVLLLLVAWYLAARIAQQPTATDAITCGLFAAAAVLTRGSALGLFIVLIPLLVIVARDHLHALAAAAGLLLVLAVGVSPWVARNYVATKAQNENVGKSDRGELVLTTCSVGRSLYEAVGPQADGGPAMDKIDVPARLAYLTEHDVDRHYWNEALNAIRKDPKRFLNLAVIKFFRTWNVVPNHDEYRRPLMMIVSLISVVPLVLLAVAGWWLTHRQWRQWTLILLPVVFFTLLHVVFVGSVRYRMPVMGFLMVLAGVPIAHLLARVAPQESSNDAQPTQPDTQPAD